MKAIGFVLLALVCPAAIAGGLLRNDAALAAMCDTYAEEAGIMAGARDKGIAYADAQAGLQNDIARTSQRSHMERDDKAFYVRYISGAPAFAYMTPMGTPPAEVRTRARTACRNQFGL